MARILPLRGLRFDTSIVNLGTCLAPPYDVISDDERDDLYGRDLRNIVRIDYGKPYEDDVAGERDQYTRARQHMDAWLGLGILRRDERPAFYVSEHRFRLPGGGHATRRGVYALVPAQPWERAEILPHEHTLRGPKEDRLRLMSATRTQTSAIFGLWSPSSAVDAVLAEVVASPAGDVANGTGDLGAEQHRMWVVDDPTQVEALVRAFEQVRLYIADGHHRYETAVAYAEQTGHDGGVLLHLVAADDPALEVAPTHRVVPLRDGMPADLAGLRARLGDAVTIDAAQEASAAQALLKDAAGRRSAEHALVVVARGEVALMHWPRHADASALDALDVAALQDTVFARLGLDGAAISGGALRYTRDLADAVAATHDGTALAFCVTPCTTAELLAVADAHAVMPQKSTYFQPKVPTGLVLHPLD